VAAAGADVAGAPQAASTIDSIKMTEVKINMRLLFIYSSKN
jgi:hypothetical protein